MTKDLSALWPGLRNMRQPLLLALVGSNGAGKSTFYWTKIHPTGIAFLNADLVAKELQPDNPEAASYQAMHVVDRRRHAYVREGRDFCFETVLSDPKGHKLRFFQHAQSVGYTVVVIHIRIRSPELSALRVAKRVTEGGHNVPLDKISDRFPRTQMNVQKALHMADVALVYDNDSSSKPYQLMEVWLKGNRVVP